MAADFLDKTRDIDVRRTSRGAGCVVTEIATVRLDQCLGTVQRRLHIGKVGLDLRLTKPL